MVRRHEDEFGAAFEQRFEQTGFRTVQTGAIAFCQRIDLSLGLRDRDCTLHREVQDGGGEAGVVACAEPVEISHLLRGESFRRREERDDDPVFRVPAHKSPAHEIIPEDGEQAESSDQGAAV